MKFGSRLLYSTPEEVERVNIIIKLFNCLANRYSRRVD